MKIIMHSTKCPEASRYINSSKIIVGLERDDRGGEARKFAQKHNIALEEFQYNSSEGTYCIGGVTTSIDDLSIISDSIKGTKVLIDATTIGFIEMLLTIRAAKIAGLHSISFSYVEPLDYTSQRTRGVLHARDFFLSENSELFTAVPGSAVHLSRGRRRAVVIVGYEGDRLQKVFEQTPIEPKDAIILLGVPAFQAGWEMNSYANIVNELDERRIAETSFAGATNPLAVYREIKRVRWSPGRSQELADFSYVL